MPPVNIAIYVKHSLKSWIQLKTETISIMVLKGGNEVKYDDWKFQTYCSSVSNTCCRLASCEFKRNAL